MYLGLDLGTASLKALLLSETEQVTAISSAPYPVLSPQPHWAESEPQAWWEAAKAACAALPQELRSQVRGIGLSGQMHGLVLASAQGLPLRPAILWLDNRTAPVLPHYRAAAATVTPALVNPVTAGMFGPTLLWVKENEPHLYGSARLALLPKDWLRLQFTGQAATDPSDVSGTLLGTPDGAWHLNLAEVLGLDPELLPPVLASGDQAGTLRDQAAAELGLPAGVPVVTGAGDTAASLFGSGLAVGEAQLTVGSAAQIVRRLDRATAHPALQLYRAATPDWYALAAIQNAGLALEWVRQMLNLTWEAAYAEAFAQNAAPELAFLPYLTGERTPLMNHRACGSWSGLRLGHTRGHLMRSALEGVAFALRDGLDTLQDAHGPLTSLRLAGGGTRDPRWQQLLADALGKPLAPSEISDASGRGAALLARLNVSGALPVGQLAKLEVIAPGPLAAEVEHSFIRWKALQRHIRPWWEVS